MTTKKPLENQPDPPQKPAKPGEGPVTTQMLGEHGDDDLGYDPSIIKTEPIPDED